MNEFELLAATNTEELDILDQLAINMAMAKKKRRKKIMYKEMLDKKVIIRGNRSGVFFGTLKAKDGTEVKLADCRRLWYWEGSASISQLAVDGTTKPDDCKFTVTVESIIITDVIEIIPCTDKAIKSIEGVPVWKM